MKVFVAGATGGIGTEFVPRPAAAGHDVVGMARSRAGPTCSGPGRPAGRGRRARSRRGLPCRDPNGHSGFKNGVAYNPTRRTS